MNSCLWKLDIANCPLRQCSVSNGVMESLLCFVFVFFTVRCIMWDPTTRDPMGGIHPAARDPRDGIHALWSGSTES